MSEMPRALLVEDVSDTRHMVEFVLSQEGWEVISAQTANDGLDLARSDKFTLIILDIGLPDKDGLELCRQIREFDQQTPILFYTAYGDLLNHDEAKEAGAQGCLRKPEDTARLHEIARQIVEGKSDAEQAGSGTD